MVSTPRQLKPAQDEVSRTAHDQDLIEVPKRARLDREREYRTTPNAPEGGAVTDSGAVV